MTTTHHGRDTVARRLDAGADAVELRTDRLRLRRFGDADRAPFAEMNADPRVMEHFVTPLDRVASDAFVDLIESRFTERGYSLWAIEVVGVRPFAGYAGLRNTRSRAVMERIGLRRVTGGDFAHPSCPVGHPVRPHVLYRFPDLATRRRSSTRPAPHHA